MVKYTEASNITYTLQSEFRKYRDTITVLLDYTS